MKNLHKFNKFSNFKRYFGSSKILNEKLTTEQVIQREKKYAAHTYHSLEVVWSRASGVTVWDPEGRKYLDFLASYSASNQGHCHPRLVKAMTTQANILDLSSRAFYSEKFGEYAEFVTKYFGYGAVLPMNSGAEGVEGAMKLARKWGYVKKKIPENQGEIITFTENFHGRTITIVSMSTDPEAYTNFGPRTSGFVTLPYDDVSALEDYLNKNGSRVSAVLIEPIQGEAGIKIPQQGYLKSVSSLCKKHNVLFMADEIQSGLGRAGKLLAVDYEEVRPDVLILGKALSGGMFPVSAILSDWPIMESIRPGQHGSTYGGHSIGCAVAIEALKVIQEEGLVENSYHLGKYFRESLTSLRSPYIKELRGRGLMNALEIHKESKIPAWDICLKLRDNGLLCKPTHENIIRLTPPLVITKSEIDQSIEIINKVFKSL